MNPCLTCGADFEPCYCNAPIVCPGCYSVGEEPCAVDCIDTEIAREACEAAQARWEDWQGWNDDGGAGEAEEP